MLFGIGRDRDLKTGDVLDASRKVRRVDRRPDAERKGCQGLQRIAAQGHDMAHAHVPIAAHDGIHLFLGGGDAG